MLYLDPRASFHFWRFWAKGGVMQRDLEVKWSNLGSLRGRSIVVWLLLLLAGSTMTS